jgi:hypothetical protein
VPIGLARSPFVVALRRHIRCRGRARLWGFYAAALLDVCLYAKRSSHRLWLPFRVSPTHTAWSHTAFGPWAIGFVHLAPSEVFPPSAFYQPRGATYVRRFPISPGVLRPQDFSSSRRFAPPTTCRVCFTPVPLMGFHPSRLCSSAGAVRSFERRFPLGVGSGSSARLLLQGLARRSESRLEPWGSTKDLRRMPPWAFFPPRLLT